MDKNIQNLFGGGLDKIIKNQLPCNSEEDVRATNALNEKMVKLQSQLRMKLALSKVAAKEFVITT